MTKYLLDTDVLIDFLRGHPKAKSFVKSNLDAIVLSSITVAELYSGVRDGLEKEILDEFIEWLPVLPVTREIAEKGGLLKREFFKSHGTGLADAMIASTALTEGAVLCSHNKKHFPMLKDLKVPYKK